MTKPRYPWGVEGGVDRFDVVLMLIITILGVLFATAAIWMALR